MIEFTKCDVGWPPSAVLHGCVVLKVRTAEGGYPNTGESSKDLRHHASWFDAGQPEVESLEAVSQSLVVDPQQMQNGCMQVANMHGVLSRVVASARPKSCLDREASKKVVRKSLEDDLVVIQIPRRVLRLFEPHRFIFEVVFQNSVRGLSTQTQFRTGTRYSRPRRRPGPRRSL